MIGKLNKYGDKVIPTTGFHGADISSQRIDDLDKENLKFILDKEDLRGLDIGCGFGYHGIRLAMLNAKVYLIDILNIEDHIRSINLLLSLKHELEYLKIDVNKLKREMLPSNIDFVYSQRFIHYLKYNDAKKFLKIISSVLNDSGMIYLSASGLGTELSTNYKHKGKEIFQRFSTLSKPISEKHNIYEPVCLYSKSELEHLLIECGFRIEKIWESSFGNIKAIAKK